VSALLYKCLAKSTDKESGAPRFSRSWETSRRAWFKIYEDRIEKGDWTIPYHDIESATAFRTSWMFIPFTVLELTTPEQTYQFGFNPWSRPLEHLPVEVESRKVRLRYSLHGFLSRMMLILFLAYLLWKWIT